MKKLNPIGLLMTLALLSIVHVSRAAEPIKALLLDGQNNHAWKETTPVLKKALEDSGMFTVDVATSPADNSSPAEMAAYQPDFAAYDVVLTNYNGQSWSGDAQKALLDYVSGGGGFVVIHAADNSFGDWPEYNRLIGLGGWGNRNEDAGPYVYFKEGRLVRDSETPGNGGSHGPQHEFQVVVRDANHPITADMPPAWLHVKDELYDSLRGPAAEMRVLATSYSPKSGRHEPMILTIRYEAGRVFHTPMGHSAKSMKCAGFVTTLLRGTEWAATGNVTTAIPEDFPSADATSMRDSP